MKSRLAQAISFGLLFALIVMAAKVGAELILKRSINLWFESLNFGLLLIVISLVKWRTRLLG